MELDPHLLGRPGARLARQARPRPQAPPVLAIYKPARGERPLWDFPSGLWKREVAAYEVSAFIGWDIVPSDLGPHRQAVGDGLVAALCRRLV